MGEEQLQQQQRRPVRRSSAQPAGVVAVRDSKNPEGGALIFAPEEWTTFIAGIRDGQLS